MLLAGLGSVRIVKNYDLGFENAADAVGRGQHFQDLGHSFSLYGPPSRPVTYMVRLEVTIWLHLQANINTTLMRPGRPKQYCLQLVIF